MALWSHIDSDRAQATPSLSSLHFLLQLLQVLVKGRDEKYDLAWICREVTLLELLYSQLPLIVDGGHDGRHEVEKVIPLICFDTALAMHKDTLASWLDLRLLCLLRKPAGWSWKSESSQPDGHAPFGLGPAICDDTANVI